MYDHLERMEARSLTSCVLFFTKSHLRDTLLSSWGVNSA